MSLTDGPLYCTQNDIQRAMQEADRSFGTQPLSTEEVDAARGSASEWVARRTGMHFYDSGSNVTGTVSTSAATATGIQLSVPASPHPQQGQLVHTADSTATDVMYPKTHAGRYCRVKQSAGAPGLPHRYVESIDTLEHRERGGEVTDWVADASITEGRGEDYYLQVDGGDRYGRSYLYVDAGTLGAHFDFQNVFTADVSYGLDWADKPWPDVRRGVAHLAAAELTKDDDLLAAIPEGATLTNVDTKVDMHFRYAFEEPGYLSDYQKVAVA